MALFRIISKILVFSLILGLILIWQGKTRAQPALPFYTKTFRPPPTERYVPDEIIVKFKPGIPIDKISEIYQKEQISQEKYVSPFAGFRVLKIPQGKAVEEIVYRFQKNPLVDYAEPNSIAYAFMVPTDPYYHYQWHFDDNHTNNPGGGSSNPYGGVNGGGIRMEEAWNVTTGSSSIVVAVLDTGVAYENYGAQYKIAPDLTSTNFWINSDEIAGNGIDDDLNGYIDDRNGWDFVKPDAHPNDDEGHGTHVTGTIAQSTNNNSGVAGIAFNTSIMPVKVLDRWGSGTAQTVAGGIYYATDNGADIINMSLGWPTVPYPYDPGATVHDAVTYAYNNGVTLIAATGNEVDDPDYTGGIAYPAAYSEVTAVGATRYDETRSYYSNYGEGIDLVAPGGDTRAGVDQNEDGYADGVLQQTFGNNPKDWGYWFYQGTSMSTPHVSGVAALLLAQNPSWGPEQVRNRLNITAEDKGDSGWDQYYGYGIVDAKKALTQVAISITTNGSVDFGVVVLEETVDSLGDVQTIHVDAGPVNLTVKSTRFSDGINYWDLGISNGDNQVEWDYSPDSSTWYVFTTHDTLHEFVNNLATGANQNIYFRLTMPTTTSSYDQHGATVTIVATAPAP